MTQTQNPDGNQGPSQAQSEPIVKAQIFHGVEPGPTLLVLGCIHGNETAGKYGIESVVDKIASRQITLQKGTLIVVPVANEKAYHAGTREVEANLNRVIKHHPAPKLHEEFLANQIAALIDQADYVLDLHTNSAENQIPGPFAFQDFGTPEMAAFAHAMGLPIIVKGWPEIYAAKGMDGAAGDTIEYAHQQGKVGVLVECGQHADSSAPKVAEACILRAFNYLGMIAEAPYIATVAQEPSTEITMTDFFTKDFEGQFTKIWKNFEFVPAGTVIYTDNKGKEFTASTDCVIVLPKHFPVKPGGELFYLGQAGDYKKFGKKSIPGLYMSGR